MAFMSLCGTNVHSHTYSLLDCTKPSDMYHWPKYCPPLPTQIRFPQWMLPLLSSRRTTAIAVKSNLIQTHGLYHQCLDQATTIICQSIPFCSSDGKRLLSGTTKQDCISKTSCLTGIAKLLVNATLDCGSFPDSEAKQELIESDQGYGDSTTFILPETTTKIVSSIGTTVDSSQKNINAAQSFLVTSVNSLVALISMTIIMILH
ncbi:uncharacterized protein TRIADDRAFT_58363 [Trichoplax adhaerens]|uniref:FZ domain-containing protein n=1 Tax=Trichoplax adhaerens TaxID=10228 RepID=B3S1W5_TRIAD|nr:predicted protein [Trichoplax adhaerens]EDV23264.1 predicted protein [Trichoplax adhaerens]|eukprot:XP_002114174.1 predicted protein [Trichoplax adhaerens]